LGSYEYARRSGRTARLQALSHELNERYETYTALRDDGSVGATIVAGGSPELDEANRPGERPALRPNELPPDLAEFLKDKDLACLTHETDQGTVFVVKLPRVDIDSLRGNVPVQVRHELYDHPRSPVIRTLIHWYDQPQAPLALETFANPGDPQQRQDFADIGQRETLRFLFYDEGLSHTLSKLVPNHDRETIDQIVAAADQLLAAISPEQRDF